jgi:hypothetical protein
MPTNQDSWIWRNSRHFSNRGCTSKGTRSVSQGKGTSFIWGEGIQFFSKTRDGISGEGNQLGNQFISNNQS